MFRTVYPAKIEFPYTLPHKSPEISARAQHPFPIFVHS